MKTFKKLKHIYLLFAVLASCTTAFAQLQDGSIAPDFTATDINGVEWNLYDLLDEGNTVILDFSATWCGPCWNYALSGVLEDMYLTFGPEGTGDLYVFYLESDDTTTNADLYGTGAATTGDWVSITNFPIIDNASNIFDSYSNTYYPTIYTVCPDGVLNGNTGEMEYTLVESGQNTFEGHVAAAFMDCANSITGAAPVISYNGETSSCGGSEWMASTLVSNLGSEDITAMTFSVSLNGVAQPGITWEGVLSNGGNETVDLGSYNEVGTFDYSLIAVNGAAWNAEYATTIVGSVESSTIIQVRITTDNWPEETSWTIETSDGSFIDGIAAGSLGNATDTEFTWDVALDLNECYVFTIYDSYGDGLNSSQWGNYADGSFSVVYMIGENEVVTIISYDGATDEDFTELLIGIETIEFVFSGCTDSSACNYMNYATEDDGTCEYPEQWYDCFGECISDVDNDGICDELEIIGCTDLEAFNYNPEATDSDNTLCIYFVPDCNSFGDPGWLETESGTYPEQSSGVFAEMYNEDIVLHLSTTIVELGSGVSYALESFDFASMSGLPDGLISTMTAEQMTPNSEVCVNISGIPVETGVFDILFTGEAFINVFGNSIYAGVISVTHTLEIGDNPNPISGCTYPGSDNYLLYAMVDDGSCMISGCTDPEASNFHAFVNLEDGSCLYISNVSDCIEDLNQDGTIGTPDLLQLLSAYGQACE